MKLIVIFVLIFFAVLTVITHEHQHNITDSKIHPNASSTTSESLSEQRPSPSIVTILEAPDIALNETGKMFYSKDENWWLNSGGRAMIGGNTIQTIQGDLQSTDRWAVEYRKSDPRETDDGIHPQNIFRLVSRKKYLNVTQEVKFKINKYNLSSDSHRSASNGVLFFHHYQDGDNLYYAGIRVDGAAVIKKKIGGTYYTMAYQPIYQESKYDRDTNPNLIPTNKWIGIKSEITNTAQNSVDIKLYGDLNETGGWILLVEAVDDGSQYGKKAILNEGYVGIRSDFMDVEFKDYSAEAIKSPININ